MRTQSEIFKYTVGQMRADIAMRADYKRLLAIHGPEKARAAPAEAEVPPNMSGRFGERGSPYGVGIRLNPNGKYNPYIAHIHRNGRQINIGSYPTLAAAQQGQRLATAGLPLRSGTKAGQVI
jgi:hypothetical protein